MIIDIHLLKYKLILIQKNISSFYNNLNFLKKYVEIFCKWEEINGR